MPVGSLQVCERHEVECESMIHSMNTVYEEQSEAVLLVDKSNAFNSLNQLC